MTESLDVALIGAGPYALSISAHLSAAKIDHQVFGIPMASWRQHMPPGMLLKSYGESSSLYDPNGTLTFEAYCRQAGTPYHPSFTPVSREAFVDYGHRFQRQLVPHVIERHLVKHSVQDKLHQLVFDNGEIILAKNVVMAVGALPFAFSPAVLSRLPRELASHSATYGALEHLRGKEITLVGGGSSALDIAALLSDLGARTTMVLRQNSARFQTAPPTHESFLHKLFAPDANGLGDGWLLRLCANSPQTIHKFPDRARRAIVANTLGPAGGYFVKASVTANVFMRTGRQIAEAAEYNGRVRLTIFDSDKRTEIIESDHLIAATGYRVDLHQLSFLTKDVLDRLRTIENIPVLSSSFESSVPGLFFVGLTSARSFGPVMRFLVGARYTAQRLTRTFVKRLQRRSIAAHRTQSIPDTISLPQ
ncbi:MAG TPA: SidA/IucD/PvdA family monooxygenase [Steroidobacteraceae bacterium]|nr:SidA/IucD/PvdA family monooxygenase [Steroidobacteraceae bacterium]